MITANMRVFLMMLFVSLPSACSPEEKRPENSTPAPVAADNTARNERDSSGVTTTPEDQGQSETDLGITANIRKAIVEDKSLSVNAENVKIITNAGTVTLRGPVNSHQEKSAIETKARQIAGVKRVDNQLEIALSK